MSRAILLLGLAVPFLTLVSDDEATEQERQEIGWDFKGKQKSENFLIYYGTSAKLAKKLAVYGEALVSTFQAEFGKVMEPGAPRSLRVYLFRTKDQYASYLKERAPGMATTLYAQYDPFHQIAYICKEGSSEKFLIQGFVHENTHALCGRLMGGGVSWLLEGWADYMALSVEHKKQRLSLGKVYQTKQSGHATVTKLLIRRGQALPLSDLVEMDRVTFSRLGLRSYPQSWALFYFLRHYGGGVYREGLDRYIKAIAKGKRGKAVFEKEIGPLESIEKEWRDYVRSIPTRRAR